MLFAKDWKVELNQCISFDDILIHHKLFFSLIFPIPLLLQLKQLISLIFQQVIGHSRLIWVFLEKIVCKKMSSQHMQLVSPIFQRVIGRSRIFWVLLEQIICKKMSSQHMQLFSPIFQRAIGRSRSFWVYFEQAVRENSLLKLLYRLSLVLTFFLPSISLVHIFRELS